MFNVGIGVYRKKDYQEIRRISEDRDNLDETWEDWKKSKDKAKKGLKEQGLEITDILVLPKELVKYCRKRGLSINASSRAQYIQKKVSEL